MPINQLQFEFQDLHGLNKKWDHFIVYTYLFPVLDSSSYPIPSGMETKLRDEKQSLIQKLSQSMSSLDRLKARPLNGTPDF